MNWLGRMLFGSPDRPIVATPLPDLIQCRCGARDFARLFSIVGMRVIDGRAESVERGARVACQHCANVFSVGPDGRFDQDARSFPPTPMTQPSDAPAPAMPELPIGERARPLPIPRERPRID